jgi:hypothetical protein
MLGIGLGVAVTLALSSGSNWGAALSYASSNGNDNNANANDNNGNANGNGNKSNANDNNGNDNVSSGSTAIATDAFESIIGAQPNAPDTVSQTIGHESPIFNGNDGVVTVQWVGGGDIRVTHDPVDVRTNPGPRVPPWLHEIREANLKLVPVSTPNSVNIVMHYTQEDIASAGVNEAGLRMAYYNPVMVRWVELPVTVDTVNNTVTTANVDVSAFGSWLTQVGIGE